MTSALLNIDLAYFTSQSRREVPSWPFGMKRAIDLPMTHLAFTIQCLLEQTNADWILFWDLSFGFPDTELIQQLANKPVDAWHTGLKLGLSGLPKLLNEVEPTWMYNKDADEEIEHSSFRLSLRACLIRTDVLRKVGFETVYSSLEMAGVALGYKMLKLGAIIRYHPLLVKAKATAPTSIELREEWIFARQFFTRKWQLWCLLQSRSLKAAMIWRRLKHISLLKLQPSLHYAGKTNVDLPSATISVLAPTLDRYNYLLNELEQLSQQTLMPLEVLITDQTDIGKRQPVESQDYPALSIRYFPQDSKGQVIAWNKVLEEARGDYVLFLGDDADGIAPDFLEKLLQTQARFQCDMVAANVIELGISYSADVPYYYMSDTFPITLIKKSVLLKTGFMDMFFNKNIRADGDLAMRCHLHGALMVFDPCAKIYHHRAPSGGLRAHKARMVTRYMSKNSITSFVLPTSSEIYLMNKYFSSSQYDSSMRIKYFSQLSVNGGLVRKVLRVLVLLFNLRYIRKMHKANHAAAMQALNASR